ncbi:MAG TPA: DUF3006 domain-containing protein [Pyrinomonadaceae bacterium]|jgi:hypothetical protein|nr:DUF3006 domain-containing protein [Pyrinomonadaceae bacterium]
MAEDKTQAVRAVIDRIEDNGMAVLTIGDGKNTIDVPVSALPEGVSDGDHLRLKFSLDREAKSSAAERIAKLQQQMQERDGAHQTGQKDFKI